MAESTLFAEIEWPYAICPGCRGAFRIRWQGLGEGSVDPGDEVECADCGAFFTVPEIAVHADES